MSFSQDGGSSHAPSVVDVHAVASAPHATSLHQQWEEGGGGGGGGEGDQASRSRDASCVSHGNSSSSTPADSQFRGKSLFTQQHVYIVLVVMYCNVHMSDMYVHICTMYMYLSCIASLFMFCCFFCLFFFPFMINAPFLPACMAGHGSSTNSPPDQYQNTPVAIATATAGERQNRIESPAGSWPMQQQASFDEHFTEMHQKRSWTGRKMDFSQDPDSSQISGLCKTTDFSQDVQFGQSFGRGVNHEDDADFCQPDRDEVFSRDECDKHSYTPLHSSKQFNDFPIHQRNHTVNLPEQSHDFPPPHPRDYPSHPRDYPPCPRDYPSHRRNHSPQPGDCPLHLRDYPSHPMEHVDPRDLPPYPRDHPPHTQDVPWDLPPHPRHPLHDLPPHPRDHLRDPPMHPRDPPMHPRDPPMHPRDPPIHPRDPPMHPRDPPLHPRDPTLHPRDPPLYPRDPPMHPMYYLMWDSATIWHSW